MAIVEKGQGVNVGETEIPDNQVAINISSTDAKEYITLDTTDGNEIITLGQKTYIYGEGGTMGDAVFDAEDVVLYVENGTANSAAASIIEVNSGGSNGSQLIMSVDDAHKGVIKIEGSGDNDMLLGTYAGSGDVKIQSGGVERARLYNKGVTITGYGGTTGGSPNEAEDVALYVENSTANATNASIIEINSDGNNSGVWFSESDTLKGYVGTIGGHLYVNTNSAAGDLIFRGNSTERMRIDGETGATTVTGRTTITGGGGTTGYDPGYGAGQEPTLYLENGTGNSKNRCALVMNGDSDYVNIDMLYQDNVKLRIAAQDAVQTIIAEDTLVIQNEDDSARLSIGSSSVTAQDCDLGIVTNSADDVAKSLVFTKSKNATDGGHTPVDDDTVLGNIVFEGSDSTGAFEPGAKIRAQVAAGTIGDGRIPTELIISTAPDSASAPLDALVITPEGYCNVQSPTNGARLHFMDGATERAGLKAFSGGLYVDTADSAHDIFLRPGGSTTSLCIDAGNTFVGILDVTPTKALDVKNGASGGDILCYDIYTHDGGVTSSDERMKENIVETQFGLDFINSLSPVSYKWKDTDEYSEMRTVPATDGEPEHEEVANTFEAVEYTRTHHGLIAQQVNQAVTDAGLTATEFAGYTYDPERDQHGLRYQEFIAPLIKAVQELTARIATLEAGD